MTIKINDKEVTDKLEKIRKSVDGRLRDDFVSYPPTGSVDIQLEGEKIESLFHPTGLLIRNNRPVFVYIRDHTISFSSDPRDRNRIHFAICWTLIDMQERGRFTSRYHVTSHTDDRYIIDIGENKELKVPLYPCKHCLRMIDYRCYNLFDWNGKEKIVEEFNAKDAMDRLWQHFYTFRHQVKDLRPDTAETGYIRRWSEFSYLFRKSKKFICDGCGVKTNRRLTDTHHKDGDKRNNSRDNLACLCKICHGEIHPHYNISDAHRREIERARQTLTELL